MDELERQAAECNGCSGDDWPIGCELCQLRYDLATKEQEAAVLWELLRYAHDNQRTASFDYDLWQECCDMLIGKGEPWGLDGLRGDELRSRVADLVLSEAAK